MIPRRRQACERSGRRRVASRECPFHEDRAIWPRRFWPLASDGFCSWSALGAGRATSRPAVALTARQTAVSLTCRACAQQRRSCPARRRVRCHRCSVNAAPPIRLRPRNPRQRQEDDMAKKDPDLFDRLRQVGLRKQAAKTLSGVSDNASKQAQRAARAAVSELRALADEIERRLPAATPASRSSSKKSAATSPARATTRRSTKAAAGTKRASAAKPKRAPRSSSTPQAGRGGSRSRPARPSAASPKSAAPTPDSAEPPPAASTESAGPGSDTPR
jgi:hypothetical protein